ncbi:MAG: bifunctional phosphoribosylaminoimidazolecarboxamide formyltransferase/IMP cyclohydrolase PurH [Acidimicrobiaceae bacterium]|nr:bifunctional phosphoribosylaminoimidazolecarboxamide formyltransferase/IMP cyclohydrolase PurH [Acidimicrobiaceae bacterium]
MTSSQAPRRALISVYDKTGLVDFAAGLVELGWELIASAGSAATLNAAGLATVDAADHTGSPPMLGHRVVTLHPRIHGGILADRDDPSHQVDLAAHGIAVIDLVVVNLYPFEAAPSIEMIDIGGPAMLRAAAKNHAHVAVLTSPADYAAVLDELRSGSRFSAARRRELAQKAFAHSASYETAIAAWFEAETTAGATGFAAAAATATGGSGPAVAESAEEGLSAEVPASEVSARVAKGVGSAEEGLSAEVPASEVSARVAKGVGSAEEGLSAEVPASEVSARVAKGVGSAEEGLSAEGSAVGSTDDGEQQVFGGLLRLELEQAEQLRYGENPHQQGARYRLRGRPGFFDGVIQHSGPPPSYLNLFDARTAWRLAHDLSDRPAAVIVKHANPCGAAVAEDPATAYSRAFECDPRSAFGGVVAVNTVIDEATAQAMAAAAQADVVIAPGYAEGVVERLVARRANTRLFESPTNGRSAQDWDLRSLGGGDFLLQSPQRLASDPAQWQVVTARRPSDSERADAVFSWRVCAHTGSNAVVLAKDGTAWGIGAGQQNRVQAGEIAAARAAGRAAGGACASDGFYPFADGIHAAADAGAAVVVQPGGSINDAAVIAAADERNLAMLFTGERQFRH